MPYSHYERLHASDAALLELEDSHVQMHVGAVAIFDDGPLRNGDGSLGVDRILAAAEAATRSAPRFRQRLVRIPLVDRWAWVDDERFNLHYHVRRTCLPVPGDLRRLKRLAGRVMSQQLDHQKPLWELWLVEGLDHGFAVISKVHQCLLHQLSELELITDLMHATADPRRPPGTPWMPRPSPGRAALLVDELRRRASLPAVLLGSARESLFDPGGALVSARERLEGIGEALREGLARSSSTPLNARVGPHRRVDWTRFGPAEVEEVRKAFDASITEITLATVAGGMRRFLQAEGVDVGALDFRSALSDLSLAPRSGTGGPDGLVRLPLDEPDPRKRILAVRQAARRLPDSHRRLGLEALASVADWTTTRLLARYERLASRTRSFDLVVHEVPAPDPPTELLGSALEEIYPIPPLSSHQAIAMGFIVRGPSLFVGVNSDWDATPRLHGLVEGMEAELDQLRRAARGEPLPVLPDAPAGGRGSRGGAARGSGRSVPPGAKPLEPFCERLTGLDHSFLVFEDTGAPMHVASVQIFEAGPLKGSGGGIDVERIRRFTLSRLERVPRYRQRLAWTPLEEHPVWIDDDRFNIRYHVRHTRLPHPGTDRQLKRLVGRIMSQRLDRGKPLWEIWVVEGLERDRFAIVNKTHHCMIDGIAGVDVISVLLTPEPTEQIPPAPEWRPRPPPGMRGLLRSEIRRWSSIPRELVGELWSLARDEADARHDLTERVRAAGSMLRTGLRNASNTPLNQPIGPHRRFDWVAMDLREIRDLKSSLGGTVNDVVLTIACGALRRFLRESRYVDVQTLDFRILAPVSTRTREQRGTLGNRVSSWILNLPLGEEDPVRAFEQIRRTTEELKRSRQALGAEVLTRATEWTGTTLLSLGARIARVGRLFNLVVTNVPGPQVPLYLLGSRMVEVHPVVPLFGNLAMGIALFSYDGTLHWGILADWDLVPDLHQFVLALEESFEALRKAVR